jgi:uncharacterized caspase-like protein
MALRAQGALVALFLSLTLAAPARAEKKVALVIGNTDYRHVQSLNNPANDARKIAEFLKSKGFELVGGGAQLNLGMEGMKRLARLYGEAARGADVTLFYYSGHGMQVSGTNYLLPVDADAPDADRLDSASLSADFVMDQIARARSKFNLFFLDACRNNPFRSIRTSSRSFVPMRDGLAEMRAPTGTLIGFATQPGNVASDGPAGGNSPYAKALLEAMGKPGYDQFRVVNEAANLVLKRTRGEQEPWMQASAISGTFYFTEPLAAVSPAPEAPAVASAMPQHMPPPGAAQSVDSTTLAAYQEADKRFSELRYADGREILSRAIDSGQRNAINYSYRGYAWLQDGLNAQNQHEALAMYRSGFEDLDAAIRLEPAYPNSYRHRGNMIAATWKALKRTGQRTNRILDNAISDLQNAAKLDPASAKNAYFLGEAYNLRGGPGDYQDAIRWFGKALEISPKFVAPHSGLCFAKRMLGDTDAARQEADYAARRDSDQADRSCLTKTAWERYVPKY